MASATLQPMSLMTISSPRGKIKTIGGLASGTESELLTLRILEASERKMQLIKKLLTPEEYRSLSSDLFANDFDSWRGHLAKSIEQWAKRAAPAHLSSIPAKLEDLMEADSQYSMKQLSRSDGDLKQSSKYHRAKTDVSLEKRRQAVEFFFQCESNEMRAGIDNLALELRSAYHFSPDSGDESNLFRGQSKLDAILMFLVGLLSFMGFACSTCADDTSHSSESELFFERHSKMNCSPYASKKNLQSMKSRLQLNGEFDKVTRLSVPRTGKIPAESRVKSIKIATSFPNGQGALRSSTRSLESLIDCNQTIEIRPPNAHRRRDDSKLLAHHRVVRKVAGLLGGGGRSIGHYDEEDFALMSSKRKVCIKLGQLDFTQHPFISHEERVACALVKQFQEYSIVANQFFTINQQLADSIQTLVGDGSKINKQNLDKLKALCELRLSYFEKLVVKQQRLLALSSELQSIRNEQQFSTTRAELHSNASDKFSIQESIERLGHILEGSADAQVDPLLQVLQRSEKEIGQFIGVTLSQDKEVSPNDIISAEQLKRQQNWSSWCQSLKLSLSVGSKVYYFQPVPRGLPCGLDFGEQSVTIELDGGWLRRQLNLEVRLSSKSKCIGSRLEAKGDLEVLLDESEERKCSVELDFQNDDTTRAQLGLTILATMQGQEGHVFSSKTIHSIEKLCEVFFSPKHPFEDVNSKLSKLLNRIDAAEILSTQSNYCKLDPYETMFTLQESRLSRLKLLAQRWAMDNTRQVVYLSERENVVTVAKCKRLEDLKFKMRLEWPKRALEKASGYKLIELARLRAIEFIRQLESHFEELMMDLEAQKQEGSNREQRAHTSRDILLEPKIVSIKLPNLARTMSLMMPRKRARRPLMPRRARQQRRHKSRASLAFDQALDKLELGASAGRPKGVDLESQVCEKWMQFAAPQRSNRSVLEESRQPRLVVTVQQALNVPLRLVRHSSGFQTATTRANSPYPGAASPSGPGSAGASFLLPPSVSSRLGQTTQQVFLSAPTTYVEIIFQRKQLASSLAQGQNPAWNESLFFPIDFGQCSRSNQEATNEASQSLVDDFLQLNLYDCCCYSQDSDSPMQQQPSTMTLSSATAMDNSTMITNRMISQRQRVERRLIGSLGIPLANLLCSGRIEGSFALSQPLLLDNYQFGSPPEESQETFLNVFITLDPPITMPISCTVYLPPLGSQETEALFEYARLWEQVMSRSGSEVSCAGRRRHANRAKAAPQASKRRHVRALVLRGDTRRYCLVCRFLRPIKPPDELIESEPNEGINLEEKMVALARFVSLISPLKYGLFRMRSLASSLWFSSTQLLAEQLGGFEEKALLMCNYFLYLGKCSAILLGDTIATGRCAFVIVWHEQSRFIDEQLQLQVSDLLETINSAAAAAAAEEEEDTKAYLGQRRRGIYKHVNSANFINRLPILVNQRTVQLWDPASGRSFMLNDARLPLLSVGSIVTSENVYANIQLAESPAELNYDLRLRQFWSPLLSDCSDSLVSANFVGPNLKKFWQLNLARQVAQLELMRRRIGRPHLEASIGHLEYEKFTPDHCAELKVAIERTIKSHLLMWRPNRPTYFNRLLSRLLHERLATFERKSGQPTTSGDWKSELAELIRAEVLYVPSNFGARANQQQDFYTSDHKQVISWPINLAYTSMQTIVDGLYSSGVHDADLMLGAETSGTKMNVQFLLACHVEAYPARVMSVWLYVGAVVASGVQSRGNLLI